MTTEAITFELGGVDLSLPDVSGLQPLTMPSLDSVARFNAAMQSVAPEAPLETTNAPSNTAVLLQTLSVAVPTTETPETIAVGMQTCSAQLPINVGTQACPPQPTVDVGTQVCSTQPTVDVGTQACYAQPAVDVDAQTCYAQPTIDVDAQTCYAQPTIDVDAQTCPPKPTVNVDVQSCPIQPMVNRGADELTTPVVTTNTPVVEQPAVTPNPAPAVTPNPAPVVVVDAAAVAVEHSVVVEQPSTTPVVSGQNVVAEQPLAQSAAPRVATTTVVSPQATVATTSVASPVAEADDDDNDAGVAFTEQSSQVDVSSQVVSQPQVLQAAPVTVMPSAVAFEVPEVGVASAAAFTTVQINEIAEAVAAQIRIEPALTAGDATVKIDLKPTVLEGSQISLSTQSGALAVEITPASHAVVEAIQNALPRLEAALASHVAEFHSFTVSMRKERKNEVA